MKKITLLIVLMVALRVTTFAQYKPEGYIFFEQNGIFENIHMFKHTILNTSLYTFIERVNGKPIELIRFNAKDSAEFKIIDSLYLKQLDIKPPSWHFDPNLKNDLGLGFDRNGNLDIGPFRKLYLVERLKPNEFKLILIVPFIGSIDWSLLDNNTTINRRETALLHALDGAGVT